MKPELLISAILFIACGSYSQDHNFRMADWGMTKQEVMNSERAVFNDGNPRILSYDYELFGLDCSILYVFTRDNRLKGSAYLFHEQHADKNQYIEDFQQLKSKLTEKYGEPENDFIDWRNKMYRDSPGDYGLAISLGHLVYLSSWNSDGTVVSLILTGANEEVNFGVNYNPVDNTFTQNGSLDDL